MLITDVYDKAGPPFWCEYVLNPLAPPSGTYNINNIGKQTERKGKMSTQLFLVWHFVSNLLSTVAAERIVWATETVAITNIPCVPRNPLPCSISRKYKL